MGGMFGVTSREDCESDLTAIESNFFGTDYHSHLGTKRGGMATVQKGTFTRFIHDITNAQFRSKFEEDIKKMRGNIGIGVISDFEDQPLIIESHLGDYAIATVNRVTNLDDIVKNSFHSRKTHLAKTGTGERNPTEVIAMLINEGDNYVSGIQNALETVRGSCTMMVLTPEGIYAARDLHGRTPLILGKTSDGKRYAACSETQAFPNLGIEPIRDLGPGEIVFITPDGIEQKKPAEKEMSICSFLWVYYGYPSSTYEGINVEKARYRCGAELAEGDRKDLESGKLKIDFVAGIPDSGTAHAIGYANALRIDNKRPFVKYTPTWPRSFMPTDQADRDLIARMKITPIRALVEGASILFNEDSIVRGTQLKDIIKRLFDYGAREVHMRPACPPLIHGCNYLNFSRAKSANELVGQKAIRDIEGINVDHQIPEEMLQLYGNDSSPQYNQMVDWIRRDLGLTTLKYQKLNNLVRAIGLPKERLCTYCWDKKG